jgi:hypothetical protein
MSEYELVLAWKASAHLIATYRQIHRFLPDKEIAKGIDIGHVLRARRQPATQERSEFPELDESVNGNGAD